MPDLEQRKILFVAKFSRMRNECREYCAQEGIGFEAMIRPTYALERVSQDPNGFVIIDCCNSSRLRESANNKDIPYRGEECLFGFTVKDMARCVNALMRTGEPQHA
ncbi:hypothetical protein CMI48_00445 [Candidatus Pacearchaeota archaeon]|nr:hypothetical protein [Candidatus Pacearchaeota archaeon]